MTLLLLDREAVLTSCSSTQPLCISLAEAGAPEGTVVWSWEQTAGQGRGDHSWISPANAGLWLSFVLRPTVPVEQWPAFTALVAVAAAEAIESRAAGVRIDRHPTPNVQIEGDSAANGLEGDSTANRFESDSAAYIPIHGDSATNVQIKWPNDLYGNRGKVGGVLAQSVNGGLVFGLGINVWQRDRDFPPVLAGRASSLSSEGWLQVVGESSAPDQAWIDVGGRRAEISELADRFDACLDSAYGRFQAGDGHFLRNALLARFYLRDAEVEIEDGRMIHHGRAVDIGSAGELILESEGVQTAVRSGTVVRHGRTSTGS